MENEVKVVEQTQDDKQTIEQPPRKYWFFLKNKKGDASITLTMLWVSFLLVSILFVATHFETIGKVHMRAFDTSAAGIYFSTIAALYFGRKWNNKP